MNEYHDKDDSTLVQMALLENESAFEELVIRHERAVKGTAFNVSGSRFSAEDASQDAFVSAWINLSALREREKFGSWVCSIARNHAKTLEAHYRSTIPNISLNEFENFDIPDHSVSDIFQYDDLHEKVEALSEKIRETVKLHYFSDLPIKEIARKLSISEGTVKWRLSEGRKQLRKGYGIMEKTYNENESVVVRVMRQVEALKLWRLKEDKSGFEAEYRAVLDLVNSLPDSKEKSHALADTLILGAWWIKGEANDEVYAKIKKAAEEGHNESVMQSVACYEMNKYTGEKKRDFMLNTQIPYFKEHGFWKALGYIWFWLGYEYRRIGQYETAIEAYRETMNVMPPEDEYYANAKSAIYCETKVLENSKENEPRNIAIVTTGEKYRFIDGKLYFWAQPGYGENEEIDMACIFWNLASCSNLIFDPKMTVGDVETAENGIDSLTFVSNTEECETLAGTFENCLVFEFKGDNHGLTYCKTYICPGIGIVRQAVERYGKKHIWELSKYNIYGGGGVIPFAVGNRWEYSLATSETAVMHEREIFFEVTAFKNNAATVSSVRYCKTLGYFDTFDGKIAEVTETYRIGNHDNEKLIDVRIPLQRAKELAVTKRQKVHVKVVEDAMLRILVTDPVFNPNYTEKGRWNFYSRDSVEKNEGRVSWMELEHFEWKDAADLGTEGMKMLYSFFDCIVDSCGMGLWSDEWVPGFSVKPTEQIKEFKVLAEETVTTPAGTFHNCRHISFDLKQDSYFGGKSDCWYAEGIGFVRFTHEIDDNTVAVWQLTEYQGVGEGYFPIEDGLYRKYEPENIGNGFYASLEYTFDVDKNGACIFRNATGNQSRADYEMSTAN